MNTKFEVVDINQTDLDVILTIRKTTYGPGANGKENEDWKEVISSVVHASSGPYEQVKYLRVAIPIDEPHDLGMWKENVENSLLTGLNLVTHGHYY